MKDIACHGPASRRSFLKAGVLGLSGLSLAEAMRLRAEAGVTNAARDTSVIFVWLAGGPPHMETYDMKPDAPEDYRGQFSPISTNVSGIDVCELLPMHAKIADKFTLIRSIAHKFNDHGGGFKHGQHLAFNQELNYPLPNLFVSMLQRLGLEVDTFGSSTGTMTGLEMV